MPKLEMSLIDYLRIIRKRMRIIILSFILVICSTIFFSSRQIPIYVSSCKIKIEQRKSVAEVLTQLITWSQADEMASQANFIKSYQIMEKVAEKLELVDEAQTEEERKNPKRISIIKGLYF